MKRAPASPSSAAISFLVAAQALFVAQYVEHEHTIYFWDHAMYFGMAKNLYATFGQGFSAGWAALDRSFSDNYNLIFALPCLPAFELFGVSRLVFILTNFFVFFLSYECALAFFLARTLGFTGRKALILSLVASSLIPPLWLPLLEGYPDAGAAACIVLAAALGWEGPLPAKMIRRAGGLGFALGGAILLRRHFAYPAEALLLALGCLAAWDIVRRPKNRLRLLARTALYFGVCGVSLLGLLAIVAPAFILNALTTDYNALYLSYRRPPDIFLHFVLGGFGYGLLATAIGGLAMLARLSKAGARISLFVTLFVLFWLVLWGLGPDQMGHHYMLHCLPLAISAGLAGWFVFFENRRSASKDRAGALWLLLLAANSIWALWLSPAGVWPNDNGTPGLLSAARPPVVRGDVGQWAKLAAYLKRTTEPDDRIMVVGSSFIFNQDIFNSIYMGDPGTADMMSRFPKSPEIDHEEPAPLDVFASSNIYVVPTPPQYHLDPSGQRVVTAAANQFPPPASRKDMFAADDMSFPLENGVVVKIWRRKPWTPADLHSVFAQIRRDAGADEKFTQDWAMIALPLRAQIHTDPHGLSFAAGLFDEGHQDMKLFFDHPVAPGAGRVAVTVAGNCPGPELHLTVMSASGQAELSKTFAPVMVPGEIFQPFTVPGRSGGDHFIELGLKVQSSSFCQTELRDLRVEKN